MLCSGYLKSKVRSKHKLCKSFNYSCWQVNPENVVVIGDRLGTDVALAKSIGFHAILTKPLDSSLDPLSVKLVTL
jgi:predicted HAD superfamily phosphohydrolase YqeG